MRSDVLPSQRGGWRVTLFAEPFNAAVASAMIFVVLVPTTTLVPISTVIGRSVFSRNVRQGMPSAVCLFLNTAGVSQDQACTVERFKKSR